MMGRKKINGPEDGDFIVLTTGGVKFTHHARAFEAVRETDRLLARGIPAFFTAFLHYRLDRGDRKRC